MDKSASRSKYNDRKKYHGKKPRAKEKAGARAANIATAAKLDEKKRLGDNWGRYDDNQTTDRAEYSDATKDYSHLSKAPLSKAEYFQFQREKDIFRDAIKTNSDLDKMFNLDLNLISASLASISFPERCGLNIELFSEEALNQCSEYAVQNNIKYNQYIEKNFKTIVKEKQNP